MSAKTESAERAAFDHVLLRYSEADEDLAAFIRNSGRISGPAYEDYADRRERIADELWAFVTRARSAVPVVEVPNG